MRSAVVVLGCWVLACEGAVDSAPHADAGVLTADRTLVNDEHTTIVDGTAKDDSDATATNHNDSDATKPSTTARPHNDTSREEDPTSDTSMDETEPSNLGTSDVSVDEHPAGPTSDEPTSDTSETASADTVVALADDAVSDTVVDAAEGNTADESTDEPADPSGIGSQTSAVDAPDRTEGDGPDETNADQSDATDESDGVDAPDPTSVAPAIRASTLVNELTSNGLLPYAATLGEADDVAHVPLMRGFEQALGGCSSCHAADYAVWTLQKYVSLHMWQDIVTTVRFKNGGVLFCDSCHQGQAQFLDRSDPAALELWMQVNLVDKLERVDGQPHGCETCHGDPPNYELVSEWSLGD